MAAEGPIRTHDRLRGTLRARVTLLSTVAVAAVLVLTGIAIVEVQRRQLVSHLDAALGRRADDLTNSFANSHAPDAPAIWEATKTAWFRSWGRTAW